MHRRPAAKAARAPDVSLADIGSSATAPPEEIAEILAPHPLFARFDRASLLAIAAQCGFATYPAGATIMREGDPGNLRW